LAHRLAKDELLLPSPAVAELGLDGQLTRCPPGERETQAGEELARGGDEDLDAADRRLEGKARLQRFLTFSRPQRRRIETVAQIPEPLSVEAELGLEVG